MRTCSQVSPRGGKLIECREGGDRMKKIEMRCMSVGLVQTGVEKRELHSAS